ncbi:glycoside hydrolase family 108 protein [Halonatronum saccharophilum]|uniref:glycoside hydrolase family 108 protein n=1 Tax=Halonatronum saccharophilum TaxID=150060 RepID=UPI0004B66D33|nr:glycosyl hydrolase 108 family protein [Halonatronum saccharophilum]
MSDKILSFLGLIVRNILNNTLEGLWGEVWEIIFELVIEAEKRWDESGKGKEKKKWVMDKLMKYINENINLNWIKKQLIEFFLSKVIDALIATLNEFVGNDWIDKVEELEEEWRDRFGFDDDELKKNNDLFNKAFDKVILKYEGGYVNDPIDRGGRTKYGITEETARRAGYDGDIKGLTLEEAKEIYYKHYWANHNYQKINNPDIVIKVFDQAVNLGPKRANKNLQRAYNVLNKNTITVDGIVGPQTIKAINNYQYQNYLLHSLNIFQGIFYIKIVEEDESQKRFIRGWLKRTKN